jgi:hypothetical protein
MTTIVKTYDRQTATFLAVVGQNMPEISGRAMQYYIEHPESVQQLLKVFSAPQVKKEFPIWKIVSLGTQKSVEDLTKALTSNGFRISDWAAQILKKIPLATAETEIELVNVSVSDLGFERGATRAQICARAAEYGLGLVPAEVGPQLRLQYADQPFGEWLLMAMEPITDSGGRLSVFRVERDEDGQWLYTFYGSPGLEWNPGNRWVFARRKQN